MKIALMCLVSLGVLGLCVAFKSCTKQSDCDEDECCLDNMFFEIPYCEKRYGAGKRCAVNSKYKPDEDIFVFTCPCVKNYECLGKRSSDDFENFVIKPRCIKPML